MVPRGVYPLRGSRSPQALPVRLSMRFLCGLLVLLGTAVAAMATTVSATGSRVLVVCDESESAYAPWLATLREKGYSVTVVDNGERPAMNTLFTFGERNYDHVVLLVPQMKKLTEELAPRVLVDFIEHGGNMLVGLSSQLSESWRDFAREFGLEFPMRGTKLVNHVAYDAQLDRGDHAAVLVGGPRQAGFDAGGFAAVPNVFSSETRASEAPFVFRGIAHWVGPNPLAFSLLTPPALAYQSDVPRIQQNENGWTAENVGALDPLYESRALLTGLDAQTPDAMAALASAVQLRDTSSRVVFVGSTDLFGAPLYNDASRPLQRAVVDDISAWAFQERGVLKVLRHAHERVKSSEHDVRPDYEEEPGVAKMYRIKDTVQYDLDLAQFADGTWVPAPQDLALQVEATMLDPYVTEEFKAVSFQNMTRYTAHLRLPDRHGVFTLRVNWKRHGWTYVVAEDVVPVRPYNHDEYPRMLSSSWPYLAGAFSTMVAFCAFVVLWLTLPVDKLPAKKE